ncbi:hypothetical protein [Actinoplanes sp. NPDC026619]|uniref:hypothetical protein n=1 Tax=Actinoplanes sp. NPDC026619 TaxID=3155798 RepID=UPI0033DC8B4F
MTMPAEVSSATDWDRLVALLRAQYRDIDGLYQRITGTDPEAETEELEDSEPMTDPSIHPDEGYDPDADAVDEELENRRRIEEDVATDGRLDGDHQIDPRDEPGLDWE